MAAKKLNKYCVTLRTTKTKQGGEVVVESKYMAVNGRGDLEFFDQGGYDRNCKAAFCTGSWLKAEILSEG